MYSLFKIKKTRQNMNDKNERFSEKKKTIFKFKVCRRENFIFIENFKATKGSRVTIEEMDVQPFL